MTNATDLVTIDRALENAIEEAVRVPPLFPVYVASHVRHAGLIKDRRRAWRGQGITVTSHWIDAPGLGNEHNLTPLYLAGQWIENYHDVAASKALLVYAEKNDVMRGALIEAGIAMGMHRPVVIVGPLDHPSWGSWQYHPLVHYCLNLEAALHVLLVWAGRAS